MARVRRFDWRARLTTTRFLSRLPGADWATAAGAHLRWVRRQSKADAADRSGRPFRYEHPIVGPFVYHPLDYLTRRIFLYNDFELDELRFAIDRARFGGTILDVGANVGLFTVACARAAGNRGHVVALEPGPGTFTKLTQTCAMLDLTNVSLLRLAAGRDCGTAVFVRPPSGRDVHQHLADARPYEPADCLPIETRRLDDVCPAGADSVTLVKIDVEGHEVAALEGADRILSNGSAQLIVEFNKAALAAAGSSCGQLWDLLVLTHECRSVMSKGATTHLPPDAHVGMVDAIEVCNTIWMPRSSSGRSSGALF